MRSLLILLSALPVIFFAFAGVYYLIFKTGFNSDVEYRGKVIKNAETPLPTFFLSDAYNLRARTQAMNDLRVHTFGGRVQPIEWQSLGIGLDPTGDKKVDDAMNALQDVTLRGADSKTIVEVHFKRHASVQYEFWQNEHGYRGQQRVENQLILMKQQLAKLHKVEASQFDALAKSIMENLNLSSKGDLGFLNSKLTELAESLTKVYGNANKNKEIIYSNVLGGMAQGVTLSFDRVQDQISFWDFVYFSVISGTTTGYGDILPVSGFARFVNSLQIIFMYCYLALLTSKFVAYWSAST